jgi:outer membrane protein assembly factor BamB
VYVTSVEGFIHALDAEGGLRWSYGVEGVPVGAPVVDAAGQVYVATTMPRLYGLRADGHLLWMLRLGTRFATPPVWAAPGLLYYFGRDQNLYSVPTWGSQPRGQYLAQAASAPLGSLGAGLVALATTEAEAQVFRRAALVARLSLDGVPTQPLLGGVDRWFALTRAGVAAYDVSTQVRLWRAPGDFAAASADEKGLVVASGRALSWVSPETGEARHRLPLPDDVSAPPVLTNAGIALVPLVSGDLLLMDAVSSRVARVHVASAPVWSPAWNEESQRTTAAAGGAVVTLDLSAWQRPLGGEPEDMPEGGARGARESGAAASVLAARLPAPSGEGG